MLLPRLQSLELIRAARRASYGPEPSRKKAARWVLALLLRIIRASGLGRAMGVGRGGSALLLRARRIHAALVGWLLAKVSDAPVRNVRGLLLGCRLVVDPPTWDWWKRRWKVVVKANTGALWVRGRPDERPLPLAHGGVLGFGSFLLSVCVADNCGYPSHVTICTFYPEGGEFATGQLRRIRAVVGGCSSAIPVGHLGVQGEFWDGTRFVEAPQVTLELPPALRGAASRLREAFPEAAVVEKGWGTASAHISETPTDVDQLRAVLPLKSWCPCGDGKEKYIPASEWA